MKSESIQEMLAGRNLHASLAVGWVTVNVGGSGLRQALDSLASGASTKPVRWTPPRGRDPRPATPASRRAEATSTSPWGRMCVCSCTQLVILAGGGRPSLASESRTHAVPARTTLPAATGPG